MRETSSCQQRIRRHLRRTDVVEVKAWAVLRSSLPLIVIERVYERALYWRSIRCAGVYLIQVRVLVIHPRIRILWYIVRMSADFVVLMLHLYATAVGFLHALLSCTIIHADEFLDLVIGNGRIPRNITRRQILLGPIATLQAGANHVQLRRVDTPTIPPPGAKVMIML